MPSVELSKLQAATPARALSAGGGAGLSAASAKGRAGAAAAPAGDLRGVTIEVGGRIDARLEPTAPPLDRERVVEIRKALEEGRYPLVPTRIADAMIAAQVRLGLEK